MDVHVNTNTLEQLIHHLMLKPAIQTYGEVLAEMARDLHLPTRYLAGKQEGFRRKRLFLDQEFELVLAQFGPGASTPIHNYGHQQGWGIVLSGSLTEVKFGVNHGMNAVTQIYSRPFTKDAVTYINDYQGMHQFVNSSSTPAISLHLYVEPIDRWKVFDPLKSIVEEVNVTFEEDFSSDFES